MRNNVSSLAKQRIQALEDYEEMRSISLLELESGSSWSNSSYEGYGSKRVFIYPYLAIIPVLVLVPLVMVSIHRRLSLIASLLSM